MREEIVTRGCDYFFFFSSILSYWVIPLTFFTDNCGRAYIGKGFFFYWNTSLLFPSSFLRGKDLRARSTCTARPHVDLRSCTHIAVNV